MNDTSDISILLNQAGGGDLDAKEQLFRVVYDRLVLIAKGQMHKERPDHTLAPSALVNEAYLKLDAAIGDLSNRQQFYAAAANTMRQVLIDHARLRNTSKRLGQISRVPLDSVVEQIESQTGCSFMDLDQALTGLGQQSERQLKAIEMRFFASMELNEIAAELGCSLATVKRELQQARVHLFQHMSSDDDE